MHYYHKAQRPVRETILVYDAIRARADSAKKRTTLIDVRALAAQLNLETIQVAGALESLKSEHLIETTTFPLTLPAYVDVTITEDLQPRPSLRDRYETI